jgi:hypothetical protein
VAFPCLQENAEAYHAAFYKYILNENLMQLLLEAQKTALDVLEQATIRLENAKDGAIALTQERIEKDNALRAKEQRVKEMMDALEQEKKAWEEEIQARELANKAELDMAWQVREKSSAGFVLSDYAIDAGQQVATAPPHALEPSPPRPPYRPAPPTSR